SWAGPDGSADASGGESASVIGALLAPAISHRAARRANRSADPGAASGPAGGGRLPQSGHSPLLAFRSFIAGGGVAALVRLPGSAMSPRSARIQRPHVTRTPRNTSET